MNQDSADPSQCNFINNNQEDEAIQLEDDFLITRVM